MGSLFDTILDTRPDPLHVLSSTAFVVRNAQWVCIDDTAIDRAADALSTKKIKPPDWNYDLHYFDGSPRTVNYLFLLDALNFCFWGDPRWRVQYRGQQYDGYWALAAALKAGVESDPIFADAEFWARITPAELERLFGGTGRIPLFANRFRNIRELGTVLRNLWEGDAARLVECAEHDASRLASMIAENLASFNDISTYGGNEVRFFKRAQILVADLWGSFRGKDWGQFENIKVLTAFADYKLPQILRAWGILTYQPSLAELVDKQIPLEKDSPQEVEIRSATLWAVEFLRHAFSQRGRDLWSMQVDWILWDASQNEFTGAKPYHRVRTIYY